MFDVITDLTGVSRDVYISSTQTVVAPATSVYSSLAVVKSPTVAAISAKNNPLRLST